MQLAVSRHDQSLATQLREANAKIFTQDQVIVEAQQQAFEAHAGRAKRNFNMTLAQCGCGAL